MGMRSQSQVRADVVRKFGLEEGAVEDLRLFIPITKVDQERRLVYGRVTEELIDRAGELFDYTTSKPYYVAWSSEISKATNGRSCGNLRSMHNRKVAGKLERIIFDDQAKTIDCVAKVLDDDEWRLCLEGAYTGFSQGGRYVRRWDAGGGVTRYTVQPSEVSLVDIPCLASARFELVKADGVVEERPFQHLLDLPAGDDASSIADYNTMKAALLASEARRGSPPGKAAAHALLAKAEGLGGLDRMDDASAFYPDLVSKLKAEPLPNDLLPSERVQLFAVRAGIPAHEVLKRDSALSAEYRLEQLKAHPIQRVRAAAKESERLRKAVALSGDISANEIEVRYGGEVVKDAGQKAAWIALARAGSTYTGLEFFVRGHEVNGAYLAKVES